MNIRFITVIKDIPTDLEVQFVVLNEEVYNFITDWKINHIGPYEYDIIKIKD